MALGKIEPWQVLLGTRLLALTGCRRDEIGQLKWTEIDAAGGCFRLEDTKEGASIRPLGRLVFDLLAAVPRVEDNPYVLRVSRSRGRPFGGLPHGLLAEVVLAPTDKEREAIQEEVEFCSLVKPMAIDPASLLGDPGTPPEIKKAAREKRLFAFYDARDSRCTMLQERVEAWASVKKNPSFSGRIGRMAGG